MPEIKKLHKNITIKGHVQGVGFRYTARTMAMSLGIKGFVKNTYDGNVYIEAEGTGIQLTHFIEWCHKGPCYSDVKEIIVENSNDLKEYRFFDIRH